MFILMQGHQPGVYVPLRALFLVLILYNTFLYIVQYRPFSGYKKRHLADFLVYYWCLN